MTGFFKMFLRVEMTVENGEKKKKLNDIFYMLKYVIFTNLKKYVRDVSFY